jgi:phosphatidylglycerol---prolipoprotein diacylglyceryl transferase
VSWVNFWGTPNSLNEPNSPTLFPHASSSYPSSMFEAFQLGPFLLRSHLLLFLVGLWLGSELFMRLAAKQGLRMAPFLQKGIWFLLAFLLGGRILSVFLNYRVYLQDPLQVAIVWDGQFNATGGFLGFGLVLLSTTWRQRRVFLQWTDALVPAACFILAFDWIGRFFGSLSYGKPTDMPWGVVLSSMSVRYTVPIHPVQLYYGLWFFTLTVLLLVLHKRRQRTVAANGSGIVTLVGVFLGCLAVILFEVLRGDFAVSVFAKLSDFVFLTLLFVSLGCIAIFERRISHRVSMMNSILIGLGTMAYLFLRPWISVASVEWRFSQFLAVLAILSAVVYVVVHRWKYPQS